MKIGVVTYTKISDTEKLPTSKIAFWLAKNFNAEIIKDFNKAEKYDAIILINGIPVWCSWRNEMYDFIKRNTDNLIWLGQDIVLNHRPFVRELTKNFIVCAAYENFKNVPNYHYVNWNQITTDNFQLKRNKKPIEGLFYYGSYREDRENYFKKYLSSSLYKVHISALGNSVGSYSKLNPFAKFYNLEKDITLSINKFQATVYIEDAKSHKIYSSPANRFYECVSSGVPIAFDANTMNTFNRAQIEIDPDWIVSNEREVAHFLSNSEHHFKNQARLFRDYKADLKARFDSVLMKIVKG